MARHVEEGFYKALLPDHMEDLVGKCGLQDNKDLYCIDHYIKKASTILEIGGGYGRVVDFILKHNQRAKITVVEKSPKFATLLRTKYGAKIKVIENDILNISAHTVPQSYDLITWMWGSIMDICEKKQLQLFKVLHTLLEGNGILLVDTPADTKKELKKRMKTIFQYTKKEIGMAFKYKVPTHPYMAYLAKKAGFSDISHLFYYTIEKESGHIYKRFIHILKK